VHVRKARPADWIRAARISTLPLSIAPVLLGAAAAYVLRLDDDGVGWHWWRAAACLMVAVCLQIGVNFANDYSDGIRGTDTVRSGPRRLTASGAASPRSVLTVAIVFFALAAAAGLIITWRTGHWWFIAVGVVCIIAAWFYTGGKRPYGYYALGEVAVFIFFGLVATLGTQFALAGRITDDGWLGAIAAGAFATATILIANTRDLANDRAVAKRTISVLIGDLPSRIVYLVLLVVPYLVAALYGVFYSDQAWYAFFTLLITIPAGIIAISARTPRELVTVLKLTAVGSLAFAVLLGWAIAF
jgi:1,4-dihydroxy-2-naphthoate octaprenyltransferase